MIEQTNKTWYVARRGELLAEQFLLDLAPSYLSAVQSQDLGIDYMAFVQKADGTPVVIGVEVKTTQHDIKGRYSLPSSQVRHLLNMNVPVLILVVDVKDNNIYFNWVKEALSEEQKASLDKTSSCNIQLRMSTADEREKLRQEIIQ